MVGQRKRRRAIKQLTTQDQDTTTIEMMPKLGKSCTRTNSGILVLPSLSRDPHLVQAMQQSLSNHSLLSRRCIKPKPKGYPKKFQKLLTAKPFHRRKEAGKIPPIDSRSWRKLKPSATDNPYMSGRSGHSLKLFERSRGSSRSRHSSSFYPSSWQLADDANNKNEKPNDSKNSLEEIINCASLNRTPYDHRLNAPLKTDTACQCRLKRRHEKAIQIPSTRIRSRTSCKLKRLKQLISKQMFSVVAQQTQTSWKSKPQGKVRRLGNCSLQQCRAYSGEEDNKKVAKIRNYGGYPPSETSVEESQERPSEHLSKIEKISKPPPRKLSDPQRRIHASAMRGTAGLPERMDYDIQGPPWSLHLANVKEIEKYAAESADCDYCHKVCPKRERCQCEDEDYYDEDDYDNDGDGYGYVDMDVDGDRDDDDNADDWESESLRDDNRDDNRKDLTKFEQEQEDKNSPNIQEDIEDEDIKEEDFDNKDIKKEADISKNSPTDVDTNKDEVTESMDQDLSNSREGAKSKKWKNVGFCPDVTCNRKCGHCSKVNRETQCQCENYFRGRNGRSPVYSNRSICKCCQCARTSSSNRLRRDNRGLCPDVKCTRKCRRCREVMTQTSKAGLTEETSPATTPAPAPLDKDETTTGPIRQSHKKQTTNAKSITNKSDQSDQDEMSSSPGSRSPKKRTRNNMSESARQLNKSNIQEETNKRQPTDSPKKMDTNFKEGSQRSLENRSTTSRRPSETDQPRASNSTKKTEPKLKEGSQHNNRSTKSQKPIDTEKQRSKEGSQQSMDTNLSAPRLRDERPKKAYAPKAKPVEKDNSSSKEDSRRPSLKDSKSANGLETPKVMSSTSRHGGTFEDDTSRLSNKESLGEIPVHVENYANVNAKRDKYCGDPKCKRQCRQCSEAITQTYSEYKPRCYCPCAEAVTQTSYLCLCCRRCGISIKRSRTPRRRDSGTEASTFSGKYSRISKYLPDNNRYCTENHSRRSSMDRRSRQIGIKSCACSTKAHQKGKRFSHSPETVHCGDKNCKQQCGNCRTTVQFENHLQGETNYPCVSHGSQTDLKQIIDILHKAVTGLELQQSNKEQTPRRNGTKGGQDSPLSNKGSYVDFATSTPNSPQQPCSKDTCPIQHMFLHPYYPSQKTHAQACSPCPLQVQLYALNEYSKQQSIEPSSGNPNRKTIYENSNHERQTTPLQVPNPESLTSNYPDVSFQNQVQRNQDRALTYQTPQLQTEPPVTNVNGEDTVYQDRNAKDEISRTPVGNFKDQNPLLQLPKLLGQMPFQINTNIQGLTTAYQKPRQRSHYTEDTVRTNQELNHKDEISVPLKERQPSDVNLRPNVNGNHKGQTSYYQDQKLVYPNQDVRGRRSSYPQSSQKSSYAESSQAYQKQNQQKPLSDRRLSGHCQAKEYSQDSYNTSHLKSHPVSLQTNEPTYHRNPNSLHKKTKLYTSQSLEEPKPQICLTNNCPEKVRLAHTYEPDEAYNPSRVEYAKEHNSKRHSEHNDDVTCGQKTGPQLQASNSYYRVGFTDLHLPTEKKMRKSSGQSDAFLDDDHSQIYRMHAYSPPIQTKRPPTCAAINPFHGNSFFKKQQFWSYNGLSLQDVDNERQVDKRAFPPNCESNPIIQPIWPQRKNVPQRRNSMISLSKNSFLLQQQFWPKNEPVSQSSGEDCVLNCNCKNNQNIPLVPVSRLKHNNSNVPLSRLSSYDKHILRDFERSKEVPQEPLEPSLSDCECACSDQSEEKFCTECQEYAQRKPSPTCLCCGSVEKSRQEKREIHKDPEPKTSKVRFACCNLPKRENKETPKKVEPKPSRSLFACCKKSKKEKKQAPKEVESKPSRGLFACCKKSKREKNVEPKSKKEKEKNEVHKRPSKGLLTCCKGPKKEKKETPKDAKLKKEKEGTPKESDSKPKPSKSIFSCCKKQKKEKTEISKEAEPQPKKSRSIFSFCKLPKREKKETKPSRKEKKERHKEVKTRRSCSFTSCLNRERVKREKPEPPPRPPKTEQPHQRKSDEEEQTVCCPCPKPRPIKEVRVLFESSCRFCKESSSEEDLAMCYNPQTRQIPEHDRRNYVICDKLAMPPPIYSCCRPSNRSVQTYKSSSTTSTSCDCDSSEDSSDGNENHFYTIFKSQNSNNTQCNCNSRRR